MKTSESFRAAIPIQKDGRNESPKEYGAGTKYGTAASRNWLRLVVLIATISPINVNSTDARKVPNRSAGNEIIRTA
jgi:hypothetical protein